MAGEIIRPIDLPDRPSPVASEKVPVDNGTTVGGATLAAIVAAGRPLASQAEAEAGVEATKAMTPLTTKQAINALGDVRFASAAQGDLAVSALQSIVAGTNVTVDDTDPQNPIINAGSVTAAGRYQRLEEIGKTNDYTIADTDAGILIRFNKATAVTAALPAVAGSDEEVYRVVNDGVGDLTVNPNAAELIEGASTLVLTTGSAADVWPNAAKTAWRAYVYLPDDEVLRASNNLSDVDDPIAARASLSLEEEVIYAGSVSAVALFSLIDLDVYRSISISGYARPATDTAALTIQFGDDAGATWHDGATDYAYSNVYGTGAAAAYNNVADAASIVIGLGSSDGNLTTEGSAFSMSIQRFNANAETWIVGTAMSYNASAAMVQGTVAGKLKDVGAMDSLRIAYSTGNLAQLDILVKGVRS